MNIDGLFGMIAFFAGIRECALKIPSCIYHLEHEGGSGWTPEYEDVLRQRILARGIPWIDAQTIAGLASYMGRVRRPMIFNDENWGFAQHQLPETVVAPR
jgi:hypothetical protein